MSISIKNKSGFTLVETIVALSLGMITTAMIIFVFAGGLKNIREIKNTQTLNSSAIFFLDKTAYSIKQGQNFDTSDSNKLIIDGTTTIDESFFINNGAEEATTTFNQMERSIQINFTIKKGFSSFSATTTVAKRSF